MDWFFYIPLLKSSPIPPDVSDFGIDIIGLKNEEMCMETQQSTRYQDLYSE